MKESTKKKYGLVGYPLSHSLSPEIHRNIMNSVSIRGEYKLYEIFPDNFEKEINKILSDLSGFNITIPYKEKIIPFISSTEGTAKEFGTVNTVKNKTGYSTDVQGLIYSGMPVNYKNNLILGMGGAARAVLGGLCSGKGCNVPKKIGIWGRNREKAKKLIAEFSPNFPEIDIFYEKNIENKAEESSLYKETGEYYDLIVNGTSVGMWPSCGELPLSHDHIIKSAFVYDCIYNPASTRLILTAHSYGVPAQGGLKMLIGQALASQKIWNPEMDFINFSPITLERELLKKLLTDFNIKICLSGFMGSGKTTTGKLLAKSLGIGFTDLDEEIESEQGCEISHLFERYGEEGFRKIENKTLAKLAEKKRPMVVSLGGGAIILKDNIRLIKENGGFVFFLNTGFDTIWDRIKNAGKRPLIEDKQITEVKKMYEIRIPLYTQTADCVVDGNGSVPEIVERIRIALGFD